MSIFHFKVSIKSNPTVYREFQIKGENSLYDLADILLYTFGFDLDHCFGFFDKKEGNYFESKEKYELFADLDDVEPVDSKSVEKTNIKDVFKAGKEMLFLFDYGEEWLFLINCEKVLKPEGTQKYPQVLNSVGEAPAQYPDHGED